MVDIDPRTELPSAVILNSMGFNISRSVGPALGGIIVAFAGATTGFAINTSSYLLLIHALWRWHPAHPKSPPPRERLVVAIITVMRCSASSRNIKTITLRSLIFGLSVSSILALLPLLAIEKAGGGSLTYGLMLGSFGIGAICGGAINAVLRDCFSGETLIRFTFFGFAISANICAVNPCLTLTYLALLLSGACWVNALSLFNTIILLMLIGSAVGLRIAVPDMPPPNPPD